MKTIPAATALLTWLALAVSAGSVQAGSISLALKGNYGDRTQVGYLQAFSDPTSNTVTANTGNAYLGSYQLTNDQWVFCLSPFTEATSPAQYNSVSMASFFGSGGGYAQQFGNPAYSQLSPGYHAQAGLAVLNKVTALYNWAYADTLVSSGSYTVAEKSAAFAYALWEIEGESGTYNTSAGGLRLFGVNPHVQTYASTLLDDVANNTWAGLKYQAYDFTVYQADPIASSQSFLTVTPSSTNHIPEPSSLLLLAASGLGLMAVRRRGASQTDLLTLPE